MSIRDFMPLANLLTQYESLLAGCSWWSVVILPPLAGLLLVVHYIHRFIWRRSETIAAAVASIDTASLEGFEFEVDHSGQKVKLVAPQQPTLPCMIGLYTESLDLDAALRSCDTSPEVLRNFAENRSNLVPLDDFIEGWGEEVVNIHVTGRGTEIYFKDSMGSRGWTPGPHLPAFLRDAAVGLAALRRAGSMQPEHDTVALAARKNMSPRMRQRLARRWFPLLVTGLFLTAGGALFILSIMYLTGLDRQAMFWPSTLGTVTVSQVKYSERYSQSRRCFERRYWASIEYEYKVRGRTYIGKRYSFIPPWDRGETALSALVAAHPVGQVLPVYYDPTAPDRAVIKRHGDQLSRAQQARWTAFFAPGLLLVGLGLAGFTFSRSARRRMARRFMMHKGALLLK